MAPQAKGLDSVASGQVQTPLLLLCVLEQDIVMAPSSTYDKHF